MHLKPETATTTQQLHFEGDEAAHKLNHLNELLTCRICQGYMIEPTSVDYCYHTYCRSCILKHLLRDAYCPQCKGNGGKHISEDNLRSDDTMRSLIYKLVPGLYQRECKRLVEFEEQHRELVADAEDVLEPSQQQQQQPEFFTPGEPISLSLEYHPAMLKHCGAGDKPPVCYLQCPADLRVVHLKRFLCSKYDIDVENKHVEVEVTYEDEVLPLSFKLMDVGYCYQWKRHAPMAFRYRILLHERARTKNDENNLSKVNQDIELSRATATKPSGKSVTFADDVETQTLPRLLHATSKTTRSKSTTKLAKTKQRSGQTMVANKKEQHEDSAPSNFKSLRSNDMRYSDYNSAPLLRVKSEPEPEEQSNICNLNIVVSIPQSQLSKSAGYADEGGFELKTANKKSPQSHLPKLKIELNSMKAKLTMPKSAEARLEQSDALPQQQLDLETYAKNIGLKPIEPATVATAPIASDALKYSPNASPMSSCSSSTNGSNGTADVSTSTSSSSHRKRKKKHSKEPKDANGKRKKLHAEISSQTDGKMKMKITTTHNHKAHKLDLKRSHSLAGGELAALHQLKLVEQQQQQAAATAAATATTDALNRTLGEEVRSINSLMTANSNVNVNSNTNTVSVEKKELKLPASPPLPPSLFKAFKAATTAPTIATSSPATATTTTPATVRPKPAAQQLQPKPAKMPQLNSNSSSNRKPTLTPHFVVPQTPVRQAPLPAHHMQRYLSTPSSIASAANKQPKRSISLDETQQQQQLLLAKQPRLDYQQQQQQQQQQLNKLNAAKKLQNYNPQMRLYGPELAKSTTTGSNTSNMPMLCRAGLSLSMPQSTLTITPRARNNNSNSSAMHGLTYPYAEQGMPALEIVRLAGAAAAGATASATAAAAAARLMGPPVGLPRQNNKRGNVAAVQSPPLSMPAMVKSPPLSIALSAQRGSHTHNNHNNNNLNNNLNLNNAAYRTSPPALINLRNPFPTKAKVAEANALKKPATVAAAAAANGGAVQSKTTLREFRPPTTTTTVAAAAAAAATSTTTTTATVAKDADILDLSAGTGRNNSSNAKQTAATTTTTSSSSSKNIKQPATTTALNNNNINSSSSNSLEAALNKIKQNISNNNNNNNNSSSSNNNNASATATAAASAAAAAGDDLQNLHLLSESATAREKISIKYENKPKNATLVRQQNASVRSIPNPSALAFRNQATPTTATIAAAASVATATKPLTVKADEQHKAPTATATTSQLSPGYSNNNASATSPRALKKPTTIDQVAANLNIRAEAKAAALSVEAPLTPQTNTASAKSPELEKTASNNTSTNATKTDVKATTVPTTTTATTTAAATASSTTATLPLPSLPKPATNSVTSESMSKPPVQIAATDTLASVASSA